MMKAKEDSQTILSYACGRVAQKGSSTLVLAGTEVRTGRRSTVICFLISLDYDVHDQLLDLLACYDPSEDLRALLVRPPCAYPSSSLARLVDEEPFKALTRLAPTFVIPGYEYADKLASHRFKSWCITIIESLRSRLISLPNAPAPSQAPETRALLVLVLRPPRSGPWTLRDPDSAPPRSSQMWTPRCLAVLVVGPTRSRGRATSGARDHAEDVLRRNRRRVLPPVLVPLSLRWRAGGEANHAGADLVVSWWDADATWADATWADATWADATWADATWAATGVGAGGGGRTATTQEEGGAGIEEAGYPRSND
ncbi:hypothetical protein C8R44DRAFT_891918 [Mycena epipterygia]|nr:hypothetical protein C8R44DRAFT_891918 [Mycena epipterygia]